MSGELKEVKESRTPVTEMTDRELLEEAVDRLRAAEDFVYEVVDQLKSNPMLKAFL